jgi:hypothetical protein
LDAAGLPEKPQQGKTMTAADPTTDTDTRSKSWRDVLPVHPAAVEKILNRYLVTMRREGRLYCVTVQKPSLWQGHVPPPEHFGPMPYAEANKIYRTAKLKGALSTLGITDIRAEDLERKHSRMVDAVRALTLTNARKPISGGAS